MMKQVFATAVFTFACAFVSQAVQAQTYDTAYGTGALASDTSGSNNAAFGYDALYTNTTGCKNAAFGYEALYGNTSACGNTAVGYMANYLNNTGAGNTSVGSDALFANMTGSGNVALGAGALTPNSSGNNNTAVGTSALQSNGSGSSNIALGYNSGTSNPNSASYNIEIGNVGSNSDSGTIRIGTAGNETSFFAAGIAGVGISSPIPVYINSSGQLGTVNSSIRFKEDVHDMADASAKLLELRPVTYRYKQAYADGSKPIDYGLIAEEVAQVYPDLVARDESGQIQTVQYQKLTPMLLNEVEKQHRQMEAQQDTIEMLERRLSALESATPSPNPKTPVAAEQR